MSLDHSLNEVRELWKHYDLNKSEGAAMRITGDEVKQHGQMPSQEGTWVTPTIAVKPKGKKRG